MEDKMEKMKLRKILFESIYLIAMLFIPLSVLLISVNKIVYMDCIDINIKAILMTLFGMTWTYWGIQYYKLTRNKNHGK